MKIKTFTWKNYTFQQATPADVNVVYELMQELCDYENLKSEFQARIEDLDNILFNLHCGDAILVYDQELDLFVGVMLLSYNYSSFKGKPGIFIEDFYIRPSERGKGIGTALMKYIKGVAHKQNFGRIDWVCLKNNTGSIEFYKKLGAKIMDNWLLFRLDDQDFI